MNDNNKFLEEMQGKLDAMQLERGTLDNAQASMNIAQQQQQMFEEREPGMVKEQLDLGADRIVLDYLIRSYHRTVDEKTGEEKWIAPQDEDMILFSDYGVHVFREAVSWYLTKMTLLSNYEAEQINYKMRDYAHTLNNLMFMSYEKIFKFPSIERCKEELDKRLADQIAVKRYAREILGFEVNEDLIKEEVLKEFEPRLEKELMKIRKKLMKDKYKRFSSILRFIQDIVHSAYQRAMGGMERRSLRQHMQITENKGGYSAPPQQGGLFKWGRK